VEPPPWPDAPPTLASAAGELPPPHPTPASAALSESRTAKAAQADTYGRGGGTIGDGSGVMEKVLSVAPSKASFLVAIQTPTPTPTAIARSRTSLTLRARAFGVMGFCR